MNKFFILFLIAISVIACTKDNPTPTAEVDKHTLEFTNEAGTDSLTVNSNSGWTIEKNVDWVEISPESGHGNASIKIAVSENHTIEPRQTTLKIKIAGHPGIEIAVKQSKGYETAGLYILGEGGYGTEQSEIAYYDAIDKVLTPKYFALKNNGAKLGDVGNDLAVYGSKMYCVVSGSNAFAGFVEIINPSTGVSQKRIAITDSAGKQIMPRNIEFHADKAYVTTYAKSVIRIDTASLQIDGRASLSGSYAEGICKHKENLYVCNSGQGGGNTISVINIASFKETTTITVPANPLAITATATGELYFTTGDLTWMGSTKPKSNLHILDPVTKNITATLDVRASRIALSRDFIYAVDFDWSDYSDHINKINLTTKEVTDLKDKSEKFEFFMAYGVSVNPLNNDVYVTSQGDDVVVLDKDDNEKFSLNTGVPYTSKVIAIAR